MPCEMLYSGTVFSIACAVLAVIVMVPNGCVSFYM